MKKAMDRVFKKYEKKLLEIDSVLIGLQRDVQKLNEQTKRVLHVYKNKALVARDILEKQKVGETVIIGDGIQTTKRKQSEKGIEFYAEFEPNSYLGYHYHNLNEEITVMNGIFIHEEREYAEGEKFLIPAREIHNGGTKTGCIIHVLFY